MYLYCITKGTSVNVCLSDPLWGLNHSVPPPCCIIDEGQALDGRDERRLLITFWLIFNEVNRSFQVTWRLTHPRQVVCLPHRLPYCPFQHPPWLQGRHTIIRSHCHWQNVSHFSLNSFSSFKLEGTNYAAVKIPYYKCSKQPFSSLFPVRLTFKRWGAYCIISPL